MVLGWKRVNLRGLWVVWPLRSWLGSLESSGTPTLPSSYKKGKELSSSPFEEFFRLIRRQEGRRSIQESSLDSPFGCSGTGRMPVGPRGGCLLGWRHHFLRFPSVHFAVAQHQLDLVDLTEVVDHVPAGEGEHFGHRHDDAAAEGEGDLFL